MKILVAYNGSEPSKKAVEVSKQHAKAFDAVVSIFVSFSTEIDENSSVNKARRFWNGIKEAEASLEKIKEEFNAESLKCLTHVSARGVDPADDILDYAEQICADEIIVGIEKKSKVGKFVFGSTAQKVILEARCPVLAVGN